MKVVLKRSWPALLLVALGAVLIVLGVLRGENETVLSKAIGICMECIGLG